MPGTYQLHVTLHVKDFNALETFETEAAKIMQDHCGRIALAFEAQRTANGTGTEIHIVEFESESHFDRYRTDSRFNELAQIRNTAISKSEIIVIGQTKNYFPK
jgi:uncharacterized protein (DUF1330 family)